METKLLFPHSFKRIGWGITIPALILMIMVIHFDFTFKFLDYHSSGVQHISFDNNFLFNLQSNNFTDEIGTVLLIVGLLLVAFSKEKNEDERILKLRMESLLWAVYVNAVLLILSVIFIYNDLFLTVMAYNICTTLILFIIRFNLLMYSEAQKFKSANS